MLKREVIKEGAKIPRKWIPRPRIYQDAGILIDDFEGYVRWAQKNPRTRAELVKFQGDASLAEVPLPRALSIDGFTKYAGVSPQYFQTAKRELTEKVEKGTATEAEEEIRDAILYIESYCRTEQVEQALVGNFSPNLVARLNGISDSTNVNNTGATSVKVVVRDQKTADNLDKLEDLL